ncbi:MAG: hypothetical protein QM724_06735 [Flavobacteriales bacterium]
MNTKKIAAVVLWIVAFAVPFQWALLDTENTVRPDGSANNVKGLIGFVLMLILLFAGYMLFDSANAKKVPSESHGH